jgi:hypothetical protein
MLSGLGTPWILSSSDCERPHRLQKQTTDVALSRAEVVTPQWFQRCGLCKPFSLILVHTCLTRPPNLEKGLLDCVRHYVCEHGLGATFCRCGREGCMGSGDGQVFVAHRIGLCCRAVAVGPSRDRNPVVPCTGWFGSKGGAWWAGPPGGLAREPSRACRTGEGPA